MAAGCGERAGASATEYFREAADYTFAPLAARASSPDRARRRAASAGQVAPTATRCALRGKRSTAAQAHQHSQADHSVWLG